MPVQKIKCYSCGKIFEPKTYRHHFCCRRCFNTFYYKNSRETKYPLYICPHCGHKTALDFHPKMSKEKWHNFICPFCKYKKG